METRIEIDELSLRFKVYHDRSASFKAKFAELFSVKSTKSYEEFFALKNISIDINHGDRLGIIGHNGAGKSTLLRVICRIYEPSSGSVKVSGRVAPLLEIGAGFNPELTGRDNIYLNGAILGYPKGVIRTIEEEVIEFAGLHDFIDVPVKYYSTGMYMRLAFAVATAVQPDILILDELFAGGDADFIKKAEDRMANIILKSGIMILVSHSMELVKKHCNRVAWIDSGRLVDVGNPDEIISKYLAAKYHN